MKASELGRSVSVFVAASTLIAACGLMIDPDLLIAGSSDDAGIERDEAGAVDAGSGGDAPFVDPSCQPTGPEVCDDGIDNDCNGGVDCADPACTKGFACVDAPPDGWALILLAQDSRPSCPAGYAVTTDVRVVRGDGAITCECDCGNNCDAMITLTKGTEATCTSAAGTETFQANATKCTSKSFSLPSGFAKATSGVAGTCAPSDKATTIAATEGRTCIPPAGGAGCPGAQRCLPKATGFETCVAKAGANACPALVFTDRRRSGTAVTDQRTCTGCSCDEKPCEVELQLWTHPVCQGGPALEHTRACAANGAVNNLKAYKSSATSGCTQATFHAAGRTRVLQRADHLLQVGALERNLIARATA